MHKGLAIFLGAWVASVAAVHAETFTINPAQSILTIASANAAGNTATQQGTTGFATSYTGTIDATVSGGSIQFNSAAADANAGGTYQPAPGGTAGSAPGDYGGRFTVSGIFPGFFAIRGLVASLTSNSIPLTGGNFDATQLMFSATAGTGDYLVTIINTGGTTTLTGTTANTAATPGSFSTAGGVQTLTIPVDVTLVFTAINPNDSSIRFTGNVVATAHPVAVAGVVSRKVHGAAGTFDINLVSAPSVECRSGGANGNHTLVFSFANTLTGVGGASVTSGTGSVSSSAIDGGDAHNYIVNLTGVSNAQRVTVTLANVTDSAGGNSSAVPITMDVLLGDANSSGSVNTTDIAQTKSASGQPVDASDFRRDFNFSGGTINATDIAVVKASSGTALP